MRRTILRSTIVGLVLYFATPVCVDIARELTYRGIDVKKTKARLGCKALAVACEAYRDSPHNEAQDWPTRLSDLHQPPWGGESLLKYGGEELVDPWGKPFQMTRLIQGDGSEVTLIYTTAPDDTAISQFGIGRASRVK